jgi:ABC-type Mn2+/Zn2+ transport system permease subunit
MGNGKWEMGKDFFLLPPSAFLLTYSRGFMLELLIAPFRYPFIQSAFFAVVLVGLCCAVIGVYVVLRRMAFIGDALAHTMLPGIVVAYLNQWNLSLGAVVAGVLTALGIGWLSRRDEIREDTAIGVLFTAMFALGILLVSSTRSFRDFNHILFGNLLGVTFADVRLMLLLTVLILVTLFLVHKELELTSFDPTHARVMGLSADKLRYLLLVLLALTVVSAIQVVGVVLTSALLITPAATAALLSERLSRMMAIAVFISVVSGVVGLYISFYANVSSGATIVLTCTVFFGVAWFVASLRRRWYPSPAASEEVMVKTVTEQ